MWEEMSYVKYDFEKIGDVLRVSELNIYENAEEDYFIYELYN